MTQELLLPDTNPYVTFDGRKALLVRRGPKELCSYYRIFSLGKDSETLREITYEPYNQFKTSIGNFTIGAGTKIDYVAKTITVYSYGKWVCSCHSDIITDTYTLNTEQGKFIKTTHVTVRDHEE